jgi:hypothetical protein
VSTDRWFLVSDMQDPTAIDAALTSLATALTNFPFDVTNKWMRENQAIQNEWCDPGHGHERTLTPELLDQGVNDIEGCTT